MSEALVTQHTLKKFLGAARVLRMIRAGWLKPVGRKTQAILFDPRDIRAALRRLELERCPPDKLEVMRVRQSEERNGHPRIRKKEVIHRTVNLNELEFELDFSDFQNAHVQPDVPSGQEIKSSASGD